MRNNASPAALAGSAEEGGATRDHLQLIAQSRILIEKARDIQQRTHQTVMEAREAVERAWLLQTDLARPQATS